MKLAGGGRCDDRSGAHRRGRDIVDRSSPAGRGRRPELQLVCGRGGRPRRADARREGLAARNGDARAMPSSCPSPGEVGAGHAELQVVGGKGVRPRRVAARCRRREQLRSVILVPFAGASDLASNRTCGQGYKQGGARRRDTAAGSSPPGWGGGRTEASSEHLRPRPAAMASPTQLKSARLQDDPARCSGRSSSARCCTTAAEAHWIGGWPWKRRRFSPAAIFSFLHASVRGNTLFLRGEMLPHFSLSFFIN
jgi:hypothetical protein